MSFPIYIRPIEISDAAAVYEYMKDSEMWTNLMRTQPPNYSIKHAEEFLADGLRKNKEGDDFIYAIVSRETEGLVGLIGVHFMSAFDVPQMGYWVAKEYWNRGIASAAVMLAAAKAKELFDLNKIGAQAFERNPSSQRVLQKAGFVRVEEKDAWVKKENERVWALMYELGL